MGLFGKKEDKIIKIWNSCLDYIFPKQCFGCQSEGEYLCSACFDKIRFLDNKCYLCETETSSLGVCPSCQEKSSIDNIIVATKYGGSVVGRMVEDFKYNFVESLSEKLIQILAYQVREKNLRSGIQSGVIVPIPLHKKRLAERGFNQSSVLARKLAEVFEVEVQEDILKRTKHTDQQAKLTRQERLVNIKNAFIVNSVVALPEHIILIDDVLTTGATFSEAAKILKKSGVREITCMAICHG